MKFTGWQRIGIIVLAIVAIGVTCQARAEENSPLAFITEYIREISTNENTRANAEQEVKETGNKTSSAIHGSTLIQLELGSQILTLRGMHFNPPFDTLIPNIIELYEQKISLLQKMIDIMKAFLVGPKPNVDYAGLAAEMPTIRASLDYIDKTLF